MKLLEITNNNITDDTSYDEKVAIFAESLLRDCRPFLEAIEYDDFETNFFKRGMDSNIPTTENFMIKKTHLTNRKPRDTPQEIHDTINKIFTEQYGHPYRNGLFGTADNPAPTYGKMHYIIPVGKFEFLWSNRVRDLTDEITHNLNWFKDNEERQHKWINKLYKQLAEKNGYGYTNTYLEDAIHTGNETMFWMDQYYTTASHDGIDLPDVEDYITEKRQ